MKNIKKFCSYLSYFDGSYYFGCLFRSNVICLVVVVVVVFASGFIEDRYIDIYIDIYILGYTYMYTSID